VIGADFLLQLRHNLNNFPSVAPKMETTLERPEASNWIKLNHVSRGQKVRVQRIEGQESFCNRLREMGFCELTEIQILNNSGAMLCQVCGSKVCLSRQVADAILVTPSAS
jgi:ferrous iron transport protein A